MNVYTTDKIRNVVLLGHGGCGKTSLAEAMAYLAGMTTRMGRNQTSFFHQHNCDTDCLG